MPEMGECTQTGITAMCSGAEARATFPTVCVDPPNPTTLAPAPAVSACDVAAGAGAPPAGAPEAAAAEPAGAPAPLTAPPSAAWTCGSAAGLVAAALVAGAAFMMT